MLDQIRSSSKSNNFITGQKRSGKTTVIVNYLKKYKLDNLAGFMVARKLKANQPVAFHLVSPAEYLNSEKSLALNSDNCFAFRKTPATYRWQVKPEVFNNLGVKLLKTGDKNSLVIMDELGRFESNSWEFQTQVFKTLLSDRQVLGVLKNESNSFLDKIRVRSDLKIFQIN
ncbi:MAG: nucleoside-triphosphatase [Halarsenatibacteraceae bacterium]